MLNLRSENIKAMEEDEKNNYRVKFSFLNFFMIFLILIPLDLYRFWLRGNIPVIGGMFNWWGNVFDSVLIGTAMTLITTFIISLKFKDAPTLRLSLIISAFGFVALANFFSESQIGQSFLIENVGAYLKNTSDIGDFLLPLLIAPPLIMQIIKLKVRVPEPETEFEFKKD